MKALNILIQKFIRTFRTSLTRLLLWSWGQEGQDVLLFINNIFRITQIWFLSICPFGSYFIICWFPAYLGNGNDMDSMQDRITTIKKGSITSDLAIYMPPSDLTYFTTFPPKPSSQVELPSKRATQRSTL